jgi:hypothetical protein
VLPFTVADEFRTRAISALPALRRAGAIAAPVARHPHFGAYASLAAILLGGALMMANIARQHHAAAVPEAAAHLVAPAPVRAALVAAPKPDPIAAIATPSPALPKATEKFAQRIDTTPTASIAKAEPVKPERRHRRRHKRRHAERAR